MKVNALIIVFFFLCSSLFFGLSAVAYAPIENALCVLLLVILSLAPKRDFYYNKFIYAFLFFILVSCISSNIFHQQGVLNTFLASSTMVQVLFVYVLLLLKKSYKTTLKAFIILCVVYSCCYTIQYLVYPRVLFLSANSVTCGSQFRMRLPCSLLTYVGTFLGVNLFLTKRKVRYIFFSLMCFFPILMMNFRSLIVATIVCVFCMVPFVLKRVTKTIIFFICLSVMIGLSITFIPIVQHKVGEMVERQKKGDTIDNEDYVRNVCFFYYLENTSIYDKILGGGKPDGKSLYSKQMKMLEEENGFYTADLGLIGLTFLIGLGSVIALVCLYIACIRRCRSENLQYIRFSMLAVLVASIYTSMEVFRAGNFLVLALLLYMEWTYNKEQRMLKGQDALHPVVAKLN